MLVSNTSLPSFFNIRTSFYILIRCRLWGLDVKDFGEIRKRILPEEQ